MSISLGGLIELPYYSLSVCSSYIPWPPTHPQSIRPDIPVSALPHAPQAHLRHICSDYICLFSPTMPSSQISECLLYLHLSRPRGSDFHLFIYDRHLSPRPSPDDLKACGCETEDQNFDGKRYLYKLAWQITPVIERASPKR